MLPVIHNAVSNPSYNTDIETLKVCAHELMLYQVLLVITSPPENGV